MPADGTAPFWRFTIPNVPGDHACSLPSMKNLKAPIAVLSTTFQNLTRATNAPVFIHTAFEAPLL